MEYWSSDWPLPSSWGVSIDLKQYSPSPRNSYC